MLEVKLENTTSLGISKMWSAFLMLSILPEIKNFVQISTILIVFDKIKIWTKFLISLVILTAQKKADHN